MVCVTAGAPCIFLNVLGAPSVRRDGTEITDIGRQPKKLALLTYLACAAADDFIARDKILALFWPESTESNARHALNQLLHQLRRTLGNDVITTNGAHSLRLNREVVSADLWQFHEFVQVGDWEHAARCARGELLEGVHVTGSYELQDWLERTRARLNAHRADVLWRAAAAMAPSDRRRARDLASDAMTISSPGTEQLKLLSELADRQPGLSQSVSAVDFAEQVVDESIPARRAAGPRSRRIPALLVSVALITVTLLLGKLVAVGSLEAAPTADASALKQLEVATSLARLADSLRASGALDEASRQFRRVDSLYAKIWREHPEPSIAYAYSDALRGYAIAAVLRARPDEAATIYTRADRILAGLNGTATPTEVAARRGLLAYHKFMFAPQSRDTVQALIARAEDNLRRAVADDPAHVEALTALSGVLFTRGAFAEAYAYALQAWSSQPDSKYRDEILTRLFLASFNDGRDGLAVSWCSRISEIHEGQWQGAACELLLLGWSATTPPDLRRARSLVEHAFARESAFMRQNISPRLELMVAGVAARAGRPHLARTILAASDTTNDVEALGLRAAVLKMLGEDRAAETSLSAYLRAHPATFYAVKSGRLFSSFRDKSIRTVSSSNY